MVERRHPFEAIAQRLRELKCPEQFVKRHIAGLQAASDKRRRNIAPPQPYRREQVISAERCASLGEVYRCDRVRKKRTKMKFKIRYQ
jgi:hypothetical protein